MGDMMVLGRGAQRPQPYKDVHTLGSPSAQF